MVVGIPTARCPPLKQATGRFPDADNYKLFGARHWFEDLFTEFQSRYPLEFKFSITHNQFTTTLGIAVGASQKKQLAL